MRTTVTRVTGNTTLDATYHVVHVDTDGGAVTITNPALANLEPGDWFKVCNVGTSGNDITWTADDIAAPTEYILGAATQTISDGESIDVQWDPTEGWW